MKPGQSAARPWHRGASFAALALELCRCRQCQLQQLGHVDIFRNDFRALSFFCTVAYGIGRLSKELKRVADYYRACAAEMMVKAQAAPSKATRQAYLNLAHNWSRKAEALETSESADPQAPLPPDIFPDFPDP